MSNIISAQTLYRNLLQSDILKKTGCITFTLNDITVKIDTTDTVVYNTTSMVKTIPRGKRFLSKRT